MRALLTLATLKANGRLYLTDTVVLALMNWMSKGDRATAPFSRKELSKSECGPRDVSVRGLQEALRLADSRSVTSNIW